MYTVTYFSVTSSLLLFKTIPKNVLKLHTLINLSKQINISVRKHQLLHFFRNMEESNRKIFNGRRDRFDGITVYSDDVQCTDNEFQEKLEGIDILRSVL